MLLQHKLDLQKGFWPLSSEQRTSDDLVQTCSRLGFVEMGLGHHHHSLRGCGAESDGFLKFLPNPIGVYS